MTPTILYIIFYLKGSLHPLLVMYIQKGSRINIRNILQNNYKLFDNSDSIDEFSWTKFAESVILLTKWNLSNR